MAETLSLQPNYTNNSPHIAMVSSSCMAWTATVICYQASRFAQELGRRKTWERGCTNGKSGIEVGDGFRVELGGQRQAWTSWEISHETIVSYQEKLSVHN